MLDKLREELYKLINKYGTSDARVVRKSQELDILVNKDMKQFIAIAEWKS